MPDKLSRSEQARINGAKSHGPTSVEGKAKSSANAIKHGFAAVINVVLSIEDEPAFQAHVEGFRASFQPQNYVENSLVEQLAAIQWRQSRLVGLETALIDAPVALHNVHICTRSPISSEDEYFHLVKAWQALAREPERPKADDEPRDHSVPQAGYDIGSIELVRRYQVSLDRQFRNTLLNLRQYRKDFAPTQPPSGQTNPGIEDEDRRAHDEIQRMPDAHIAKRDPLAKEKERKRDGLVGDGAPAPATRNQVECGHDFAARSLEPALLLNSVSRC